MFWDGSRVLFLVVMRTKRGLFAPLILESRGWGESLTLEYVLERERVNFLVLGVFYDCLCVGESLCFIMNLS